MNLDHRNIRRLISTIDDAVGMLGEDPIAEAELAAALRVLGLRKTRDPLADAVNEAVLLLAAQEMRAAQPAPTLQTIETKAPAATPVNPHALCDCGCDRHHHAATVPGVPWGGPCTRCAPGRCEDFAPKMKFGSHDASRERSRIKDWGGAGPDELLGGREARGRSMTASRYLKPAFLEDLVAWKEGASCGACDEPLEYDTPGPICLDCVALVLRALAAELLARYSR